jgi:hypothetical protein
MKISSPKKPVTVVLTSLCVASMGAVGAARDSAPESGSFAAKWQRLAASSAAELSDKRLPQSSKNVDLPRDAVYATFRNIAWPNS